MHWVKTSSNLNFSRPPDDGKWNLIFVIFCASLSAAYKIKNTYRNSKYNIIKYYHKKTYLKFLSITIFNVLQYHLQIHLSAQLQPDQHQKSETTLYWRILHTITSWSNDDDIERRRTSSSYTTPPPINE